MEKSSMLGLYQNMKKIQITSRLAELRPEFDKFYPVDRILKKGHHYIKYNFFVLYKRRIIMKILQIVFPSFFGFWFRKKNLLLATRPLVSIYASLLTILSFSFYGRLPWIFALTVALCFALISASIQVFNDYQDRNHDIKKGKTFAHHNSALLFDFWLLISSFAVIPIIVISEISANVAILCAIVWGLGILYSFLQKFFIAQNIIVALCASLPALCGNAFYGRQDIEYRSPLVFLLLLAIVFVREVVKDIQDRKVDKGYKNTLPVLTADCTKRTDSFRVIKPPYPSITIPIEMAFPCFRPEIFPTIHTISLIVGWASLLCLGLGIWGVPMLFMMMGVVMMFQLVLRDPDRFVSPAKNFVDATLIIFFVLMYIGTFA